MMCFRRQAERFRKKYVDFDYLYLASIPDVNEYSDKEILSDKGSIEMKLLGNYKENT
jgi:hypothetical protein